jgi:dienelactone hydrolase
LRYDKRGVGKSKGSYAKATTADFCEDAHAAIEFLRQDKRIDKNNIGIIGHSEGGVIAPIVAAKDKKLAFIVSLAGSVQKGNDLMVSQWKLVHESDGYGKDTIEAGVRLYTFLYNEVNKLANDKEFGKKLKEALNQYELTLSEQEKELLSWSTINKTTVVMQMQSNPWLIHFIALSPEKYIAKVKCPVLAIFGEKDIQVPAQENADLMRKSLQKAKNEKNSRVEIIKGTNHLLQRCNLCTTYEYPWIEETVAPEVLELLFSWINAQ